MIPAAAECWPNERNEFICCTIVFGHVECGTSAATFLSHSYDSTLGEAH